MAWSVGHEIIHIGNHEIGCEWEVDESSAVDAAKSTKIPYLLVSRIEWADVPYPEMEWVASNELSGQENIGTGDIDEDGEPITILFSADQTQELAHAMDRISESVSMADFA